MEVDEAEEEEKVDEPEEEEEDKRKDGWLAGEKGVGGGTGGG